MKKLVSSVLVALTMLLVLGSCGSTKNVAYFQNADSISLAASRMLYEAKIMPKDELTITVITTDPKAAMPFNLSVSQTLGTGGQLSYGSGSLQGYLVDNDGNIEFPVVGTLHVGGLTKKQAEDLIKNKVKPYLAEKENPIVTVRMGSYHVSVLGEVEKPGIIYAPQEKMSIPTTSLFRKGVNKMAQKVGEEAVETVIEATNGTNDKLVYEASDLLYHLVVLLASKGLRIEDIARELAKRHNPDWDKARRIKKSKE